MLIGMIISMTIGSVATGTDIQNNEMSMFASSMVGGTIGMLVSLACYGADNVKQLSRHGVTNLGVAVLFGPVVSMSLARRMSVDTTVYLVVATSGVLGISGMTILKTLGPIVMQSLKSGLSNLLEGFFRSRSANSLPENKE